MRSEDVFQESLYTTVQLESFVPADYPQPVMENRNGLIVKAAASQATGRAESDVATDLPGQLPGAKKRTAGADKNYDTTGFIVDCRAMNVITHIARSNNRAGGSAIPVVFA